MTNINLYYGYIPYSTLDANKHPDEQVADLIKLLEDSKELPSIDIYSNSPYIMFRITLLFGYSNKNIPVDKRLHGDINITNRHFEILKDGTIVEGAYYKGMISDVCLLNNKLDESNNLYSDLLDLNQRLESIKKKISELESKTEDELVSIASHHDEDEVANAAMKVLKSKFDSTYFFCGDCDWLATTESNCCLNRDKGKI